MTYVPMFDPLLFGGRVAASTAGGGTTFDVTGAWNSVKNVQVLSNQAETLLLRDFVHVDIDVGRGSDGRSVIDVQNAKRGTVQTGAGEDLVSLALVTNGGWNEEFRVVTGAGNDFVSVRGGDATLGSLAGALRADGVGQKVFVDLGDGDDAFLASDIGGFASADTVFGGAGRDTITAGRGNDRLTGGTDRDEFRFFAGDGHGSPPAAAMTD
jgi:Ca2+-binding RTX toxin-like protein